MGQAGTSSGCGGGKEVGRYLEFDVIREPWNKYELSDGSILKLRYILTRVLRSEELVGEKGKERKINYRIDGQTINVIVVPQELKGPPGAPSYSKEELRRYIAKEDIRYNTLAEEWNEYVVEDGTKIRLKTTLTSVARTSLYNQEGEPIYLVECGAIVRIRAPTPSP